MGGGLGLVEDVSGPSNNKRGAKDTVDPKDTARSLAQAGRVRGHDLTYAAAKPSPLGVVFVSEGVELFRTKKAASKYLKKQFADFKRFRGRTIEGVKVARVEEFDIATGDEAAGADHASLPLAATHHVFHARRVPTRACRRQHLRLASPRPAGHR